MVRVFEIRREHTSMDVKTLSEFHSKNHHLLLELAKTREALLKCKSQKMKTMLLTKIERINKEIEIVKKKLYEKYEISE